MYALLEPISISKGFTALAAGGFGLMAFWFSNFVPAIVPLYTSIYFVMRILFEMLLFSNFGRNKLLSYPHYAVQTEMNPPDGIGPKSDDNYFEWEANILGPRYVLVYDPVILSHRRRIYRNIAAPPIEAAIFR